MKNNNKEAISLHPANKHQGKYDLEALVRQLPELESYIFTGKHDEKTIRFADPGAVRALNKALLMDYYGLKNWEIPSGYLCPPIPGRADYIHHMADLLAISNGGETPRGNRIQCLDIGTGSSIIYPIIGIYEYGWSFIGAETDPKAITSAEKIRQSNSLLSNNLTIRQQQNPENIFKGMLSTKEKVDITISNPPFHASAEEAKAGTVRKVRNLSRGKKSEAVLNFGGQSNELWYKGGEKRFITKMISESKVVRNSCYWFSTLVSKESNLRSIYSALKNQGVTESKTIEMGQGNKKSRIVAWTFYSEKQREDWRLRKK